MKLGMDDDGDEFGSMVVRPEFGRQWQTGAKAPKSNLDFDAAFQQAISEHGEPLPMDGVTLRRVDLKHVRAAFEASRVTGEPDPKKAARAAAKAWQRLIKNLPGCYLTWAAGEGAERREWIRRKASGDNGDQWRQHVPP